jgi:Flp pilus assembly protein TadD
MVEKGLQRKLRAIFSADVKGYSKLMGDDDEYTVNTLKDFGGEQEAVELFERAMRLSPKHPWWVPSAYGVALHLVGRKEDAVVSFRNAISLKPGNPQPYAFLAAVYADLGQLDKAKEACRRGIAIESEIYRKSIHADPYPP